MKLVKLDHGGRNAEGLVDGGQVRIIGSWRDGPAADAPFTLPWQALADLDRLQHGARECLPLGDVQLAVPVDPRSKIICVGLNFKDHALEVGQAQPQHLPVFLRSADSLVGHAAPLWHPDLSPSYDYEGEIALVIGRAARHVSVGDALSHVLGYSCFMDGSVRAFQRHSVTAGKNFWRSGAMGPWIVTAEELPGIHASRIETRVNGKTVQSGSADQMFASMAEIIAYCSAWTCLRPGDVIATGTPAGVGARRSPPQWLRVGDTVEVEVAGIGVLHNPVAAPPECGAGSASP